MKNIKILLFVVLLMVVTAVIWLNTSPTFARDTVTPPPPPTPGVPPSDLSHFLPDSTPIKTEEEAVVAALAFDSSWTARTDPVAVENIQVEYYATRQEAADKYDLGVFAEAEDALDPTWVVVLSGAVQANSFARVGEMETVDGVIYLFSATDSSIVAQINMK